MLYLHKTGRGIMKKYLFILIALLLPLGALEARVSFGYSSDGRWYFGAGGNRGQHYRGDYGRNHRYYGRPYYHHRNSYYGYPYRYDRQYQRYPYSYHRYRCDEHGRCRKVYMRYRYYY